MAGQEHDLLPLLCLDPEGLEAMSQYTMPPHGLGPALITFQDNHPSPFVPEPALPSKPYCIKSVPLPHMSKTSLYWVTPRENPTIYLRCPSAMMAFRHFSFFIATWHFQALRQAAIHAEFITEVMRILNKPPLA